MKRRFPSGLLGVLAFLAFTASFTSPCQAITKRALLVGINTYKNLPSYSPSLQRNVENLEGAVNDVNNMKNILVGRFGFKDDDILVLRNEQATRSGILNAFDEWLIGGSKEGDIVFFHFSGHGTQVQDQNGDEEDGLDEALCAYEVKPLGATNIVDAGLILDDELSVLFRKLEKRSVTAFIDACHSGSVTRSAGGKPVARLEPTPAYRIRYIPVVIESGNARGRSMPLPIIPKQPDIPPGQVFLFSSQEHQLSVEKKMPDGTYQGALALGIADWAKSKGNMTYYALYEHVKDFVKNGLQLEQNPQMEPQKGPILSKTVLTPLIDSLPPPTTTTVRPPAPTTVTAKPPTTVMPAPTKPEVPATPGQVAQAQKPKPPKTQEPAPQPGKPGTPPSKPPKAETPVSQPPVSATTTVLAQKPPAATTTVPAQKLPVITTTVSMPQPPPEAKDEKVLVRIDDIKGLSPENAERLEQGLAGLDYAQFTKEDFFDRMLRGEVNKGVFHIRLVNRVGDAIRIPPTENLDALVRSIASHLRADYIVKQFTRLHNPDPPFRVRVWVTDEKRNNFLVGEKVEFYFSSDQDCYVLMFNRDVEGNLTVLFPNAYHTNNFVRGGQTVKIPDSRMKFDLQFFEPTGEEMVKVIATREPLRLAEIGIEDIQPRVGEDKNKDVFVTLRTDAGNMTRTIRPVQRLKESLTSGKFTWSDAMTIIRSYPKK